MPKHNITLRVNGDLFELAVDPWQTLVEVLREELNLTGTKVGCQTGDCGACTVLLDGQSVSSCLTLAVEADGREVVTIEGVAPKRSGTSCGAGGFCQVRGHSMRVLYSRHGHVNTASIVPHSSPQRSRDQAGTIRESVSLYRVQPDCGSHWCGR